MRLAKSTLRTAWTCFLLSVPAFVLIGVATWAWCSYIPNEERIERSRYGRLCREVALRIARGEEPRARVCAWPEGAARSGSVNGVAWGHFAGEGGERVWVEQRTKPRKRSKNVRLVVDPELTESRTGDVLRCGTILTVALVTLFSALGIGTVVVSARAREAFMEATAHDLTTPLVGLRYMIGTDDAEAKVLNERLLRIVANVRDFLRLGGARPVVKRENVDLVAAYREAYALYRADYRELFSGEDVPVEVPDGGALWATGETTRCVQILWNLLGNDLKYAAPYGRVAVAFRAEGDRVSVMFADEGPGMSARQRRRAFNRYFRAKGALLSGKGGFGIGLCASREFARAMGGDLTVHAREPKGTIFRLVLPAGHPEDKLEKST